MLLSSSMGMFVGFAVRIFLRAYLMAILSCSRWIMSNQSLSVATTTSQTYVQPTEDVTMQEGPRFVDYEFEGYGVPTDAEVLMLLDMCDSHKEFIEAADELTMANYLEDLGEMIWPTVNGMSC